LHPDILYQIALMQVANVGDIKAKKLISYCGSAKAALTSRKTLLQKIPDIGSVIANSIVSAAQAEQVIRRADEELSFCVKNGIEPLSYLEDDYPNRLRQCDDSPVVLYVKGSANLNEKRILSVVGTRAASRYGRQICSMLMADFAAMDYRPLIVSGLALGIDIAAHKAAIENGLTTAAVMAHGLDIVYPPQHKRDLEEILYAGGAVVSDYVCGTKPLPPNFLARNRIIAGMADATIVVESAARGGSLTTARMAQDYSRDVFTFPARIDDKNSLGCNALIRDNKAALATCAQDIAWALRWDVDDKKRQKTASPAVELSADEAKIYTMLQQSGTMNIDDICRTAAMSVADASVVLLSLEFNGMVRSLPGKMYESST
jgi:DNA processing protein